MMKVDKDAIVLRFTRDLITGHFVMSVAQNIRIFWHWINENSSKLMIQIDSFGLITRSIAERNICSDSPETKESVGS